MFGKVGNQAFADYVDAHVTSLSHVNNKKDVVPILPGRFLGFHHPSGEVHITESNAWDACPGMSLFDIVDKFNANQSNNLTGQDNTNSQCIIGTVPNIFEGDESDHDGPYDGVLMGC